MTETNKEKIHRILSEFPYPVTYRYTDLNELPRFVYTLISNHTSRYSNQRHHQKTRYQIDFFTTKPIDVEGDSILTDVLARLEGEGLICEDWFEIEAIETDDSFSLYRYTLDVI